VLSLDSLISHVIQLGNHLIGDGLTSAFTEDRDHVGRVLLDFEELLHQMGAFLFIFDLDRELCQRVNLLVKSFQFFKDLFTLIKVSHLDFLYCVEHFSVAALNVSFEQNQIVRFDQTKFV
jgi:hypothetical protein